MTLTDATAKNQTQHIAGSLNFLCQTIVPINFYDNCRSGIIRPRHAFRASPEFRRRERRRSEGLAAHNRGWHGSTLLKMPLGKIVRRISLYLGLALASLAILALVFALSVHTGILVPFRWVGLAMFTVVLIVATVQTSRNYWRRVAFWVILAVLLCVHVFGFIFILQRFPDFRVAWYVPVVIVEAGIFGGVYDLLLARTSR